jgi:homoserine dehydrogenase
MKIGILGFGTVGRGVAEILLKKSTDSTSKISIQKILIKESRLDFYKNLLKETEPMNALNQDILVTNISDIINDKEISVVVECMGGVNPAFEYVTKALESGKKVVTSNKMLLAEKYKELISSKKYTKKIKYESSVGGGIHIFHSINGIKKVDKITSFTGIINGTTNYILSKMTENNSMDFEAVLKEAQKLGFAEADPTNDVDGFDACFKAVLLYNEIFDNKIDVKKVELKGIRNITKEDILKAKEKNKTIKLIAYGEEGKVYVKPVEVDNDNYLAHVNKNLNCILIKSENLGVSAYIGEGAGKLATAHAVVLDIIDFLNEKIN